MAVDASQMCDAREPESDVDVIANQPGNVVYDWAKMKATRSFGQSLELEDVLNSRNAVTGHVGDRVDRAADPKPEQRSGRPDVGRRFRCGTRKPVSPGRDEPSGCSTRSESLGSGSRIPRPDRKPRADSIKYEVPHPIAGRPKTRRVLLNESQPAEAMVVRPTPPQKKNSARSTFS